MASRYNPIRETFTTNEIVLINPLSGALAGGTPPGDLTIAPPFLFNSYAIYNLGVGTAFGKFDKRDIPRIVGIGLFCNMGDCIVDLSNLGNGIIGPEPPGNGVVVEFSLEAYNAANALLQAVTPTVAQRFSTLNAIFDYDLYLRDFLVAGYVPGQANYNNTDHFRLKVASQPSSYATYSTILMDTAFKDKRFYMYCNLVIEHTFRLVGAFA